MYPRLPSNSSEDDLELPVLLPPPTTYQGLGLQVQATIPGSFLLELKGNTWKVIRVVLFQKSMKQEVPWASAVTEV